MELKPPAFNAPQAGQGDEGADQAFVELGRQTQELVMSLTKMPILAGRLIERVPGGPLVNIGTGDTLIAHLLGRLPRGWIVTDRDADARIWRIRADTRYLTLRASVSVNVALWVF